ncbi:MAG: 4-hydroxy-tetrahydrodipicolinate synthase [Candidatus Omnitrophica bacterium]|nr:4-hydroxy-tetrahydrodipicolinate synthase [Candidatus Omnitrophota bacterium]
MFQGSMVALVTPFRDGSIDWDTLKKLADWHMDQGTDIIIPCGTTGESATMSHEEHRAVMDFVIEHVDGRVPVICGAGSNSTEEAVGLVKHAKKAGAAGVLVVTPYYNKPTQEGLYRHYEYIAGKVDIPIVLYNVPGRTGVSISPQTVARLRKIPNIVAIKEASGSIEQTCQILDLCDITVISGEDALTWPLMAVGAKGVISVTANVMPGRVSKMVHAALEKDMETAKRLHRELFRLNKVMFIETNPIPVKTALGMMGLIKPELRLPLCEMSSANKEELSRVLKELKVFADTSTQRKKVGSKK